MSFHILIFWETGKVTFLSFPTWEDVSSTNIHGKTPLFILCENFSHKFVDKREHRSAVEGLVPIATCARRKWYFWLYICWTYLLNNHWGNKSNSPSIKNKMKKNYSLIPKNIFADSTHNLQIKPMTSNLSKIRTIYVNYTWPS